MFQQLSVQMKELTDNQGILYNIHSIVALGQISTSNEYSTEIREQRPANRVGGMPSGICKLSPVQVPVPPRVMVGPLSLSNSFRSVLQT